ncbi:MAG: phosphoribosylaminoimidazolesuccinocarboxamide synthase, partial [Pirellulales bacterium]
MTTLLQTDLGLGSVHRGKVRDCYDLGEQMLIVSTDRISAFDWILPTPIPDKGRVLTAISAFWFEWLGVEHHLITTDVSAMGLPARVDLAPLVGRSMLVRKASVVPFECVVRGWLAGSGLKEYREAGT